MAIQFIPTDCPKCNGKLNIDLEKGTATCEYCQSRFLIADTNDGVTRVEIVNAEQAGIDFGKGLEAAKKKEEENKGKAERVDIIVNKNSSDHSGCVLWVFAVIIAWLALSTFCGFMG
jgi:DNA-directed RNA polymerase subunit RPC12/RpoP